jgi:hypothetical protein
VLISAACGNIDHAAFVWLEKPSGAKGHEKIVRTSRGSSGPGERPVLDDASDLPSVMILPTASPA